MYEGFRDAERDGWHARAGHYADATARITTQAIPALLGQVRCRVGLRLLDICCGPGFAAGAAQALGAEADGLDFAPDMVAVARERFPGCRFHEGDALDLPFADASFDAAICAFGLLHVTDPGAALAEARRVTRTKGRCAFSLWDAPAEGDLHYLVNTALARHSDPSVVPEAPDAYALTDRARARATMEAAGFEDIAIDTVAVVYHPPPGDFTDGFMTLSVRAPMVFDRQSPEAQAAIRAEIEAGLDPHRQADGSLAIPAPAIILSGVAA